MALPLGTAPYVGGVETLRPIQLPVSASIDAERALAEIEGGIELVVRGLARRVHITGLAGLDDVAAQGLASAQAAGVRFVLAREVSGAVSAIIGPRKE